MAEKMNACSTPLPYGESEIPLAGFTVEPSATIRPPRVAEAPVALECTRHTTLELGNRREIVVGEVRSIAIRDVLVLDEDRKSTRLNSSHITISYAVFCLKKKTLGVKRTTAD